MITHLKHRSVIRVTGPDRYSFLQGIITQDVYNLQKIPLIYSLILSANGRFQFDLFIFEKDDSLYIDSDRPMDLLEKLQLYKLRSNVTFNQTDLSVYAAWDCDNLDSFQDPRLPKMGRRFYTNETICATSSIMDYDIHRAQYAIPDGMKDMQIDKSLPLEWKMDELNALSFSKGCYIGQELTTRMKHTKMTKKIVASTKEDASSNKLIKSYGPWHFIWQDV